MISVIFSHLNKQSKIINKISDRFKKFKLRKKLNNNIWPNKHEPQPLKEEYLLQGPLKKQTSGVLLLRYLE